MKLSLALGAVALVVLPPLGSNPRLAWAAEGPRDVETDHVDAYDDGGKPAMGVFANPGALLLGAYAAELDLALGDVAALSLEADAYRLGGTKAYGGAIGLPLFVERVPFHGVYVEPRLVGARAAGAPATIVGLGATAGWQETWRFGLSVKGGLGVLYEMSLEGDPSSAPALGIRPLVDAAVGWVF